MSDTKEAVQPTLQQQLENVKAVQDLFARAHDLIAHASHPGHMGMKVTEVLSFLKFHHDDFKMRSEKLAAAVDAQSKATASTVDVPAAKAAVEATLSDEHGSAEK